MNRLQFLPNRHFLTDRGIKQGLIGSVVDVYAYFLAGGEPEGLTGPQTVAPMAELELAHPAIVPLLMGLQAQKLPFPELGFELAEADSVIATAEAAWTDRRCALINSKMPEDCHSFDSRGWTVISFDPDGANPSLPETIFNILRKPL
jgi:hypothetical protein